MLKKSPFDIVLTRHVTEKTRMLEQLQYNSSNACVKKCVEPKYVFIVDKRANKQEIAAAVKEIYPTVTVVSVNTVSAKPKARRMRGHAGVKPGFKKAIVTLQAGDIIEEKA